MHTPATPEPQESEALAEQAAADIDADPLARFRSWRGFLLAAIAVNALFIYGMLANVSDPAVRTWFKALVWLPFNAIATALYWVFMQRLRTVGIFYGLLCAVLIVVNWVIFFRAGH